VDFTEESDARPASVAEAGCDDVSKSQQPPTDASKCTDAVTVGTHKIFVMLQLRVLFLTVFKDLMNVG